MGLADEGKRSRVLKGAMTHAQDVNGLSPLIDSVTNQIWPNGHRPDLSTLNASSARHIIPMREDLQPINVIKDLTDHQRSVLGRVCLN